MIRPELSRTRICLVNDRVLNAENGVRNGYKARYLFLYAGNLVILYGSIARSRDNEIDVGTLTLIL